jgi:glycosyltransferase involved in cell wall biosynthesis
MRAPEVGAGPRSPESRPLVSIVTPSLNQGRYLEQAIRSVLEQDYPHIEHIVIDGGSSDETLEILRRHPQLRWISEPDGGQAAALNRGFRLAQGEIFGWINADDYYLPGAITAAVEPLVATGCGLVHGAWRQVDENGLTIRDVAAVRFDFKRELEAANAVVQPGTLFTRAAFESVGGLDETYRYALDYELWLKLGRRVEVRHVENVLAAYRYHPTSKTVAESAGFIAETWRASRSHGARLRSPIFVDYYLPHSHPLLYRAIVGWRTLARRYFPRLALKLRNRFGYR